MSKLFDSANYVDNITSTENGMKAFKSSLSSVLDLFQDGFSHRRNPSGVSDAVRKAALEDKELTLKTLFYIRDIHEGQGEREVFRAGMRTFLSLYPDAKNVLHLIPIGTDNKPYGRWDDLVALIGVSDEIDKIIFNIIQKQFIADQVYLKCGEISKISLLAKWLPSCNTSSIKTRTLGEKVWRGINMANERAYRKTLSALRKAIAVVETKISNKDYTFDYSKLPSYAIGKYKSAFYRNDEKRYKEYLETLNKELRFTDKCLLTRSVKINTAALYPYDVVRPILNSMNLVNQKLVSGRSWTSSAIYVDERKYEGTGAVALQADSQWRSLRNYFDGCKNTNWLAVVDVSGSMFDSYGANISSIDVAISLGLYVAEHNNGAFKNQLMTFSSKPNFITIDDTWTLKDKIEHICSAPWGQNTDLEAVFGKILEAAKKGNVSPEDMPDVVVIISDMQFDECISGRYAQQMIRQKYYDAGYKMPKLVFWNACARYTTSKPITRHCTGAILVGGCKPGLFEQVLSAQSPEDFMKQVLNRERYADIKL